MLDNLATRYSKLPSQVLREADSFDLSVMDVALTYRKYQQDKEDGKMDPSMYDMDSLQELREKAEKGHNEQNK
jgi:hypothetical protein|tara:strand:+ start:143 stop:361 length:219 start_codon:yes stop_codon:yes gene_type:complete